LAETSTWEKIEMHEVHPQCDLECRIGSSRRPKRLIAGMFRESFAEVSFNSTHLAAKDRKIIY
jgi:hypothetical protein